MSTANTFKSLQPDFKESYSDQDNKKKRYKRLREALKSNGKANAESQASANPMKALRDKSYLAI